MKRALLLFGVIVLVAGSIFMIDPWSADAGEQTKRIEEPPFEEETEVPEPGVKLISGNPLIDQYGTTAEGVREDLAILRDVVSHCQTLIKDFDRFHLPDNPAIVKFMQGSNPQKLAWIPRASKFVNEKGELVDRFGSPVFFHRLSGLRFEYRSAGPDRKHWTADDVIVK